MSTALTFSLVRTLLSGYSIFSPVLSFPFFCKFYTSPCRVFFFKYLIFWANLFEMPNIFSFATELTGSGFQDLYCDLFVKAYKEAQRQAPYAAFLALSGVDWRVGGSHWDANYGGQYLKASSGSTRPGRRNVCYGFASPPYIFCSWNQMKGCVLGPLSKV